MFLSLEVNLLFIQSALTAITFSLQHRIQVFGTGSLHQKFDLIIIATPGFVDKT